jgi:hypothetical protein
MYHEIMVPERSIIKSPIGSNGLALPHSGLRSLANRASPVTPGIIRRHLPRRFMFLKVGLA